ncbi:monovalent cation:proton antiporter-2 (CPA2) family protein [Comamonas sp. JC664]|uniref:monovalent cation:proton antiporter-2 (CPA2) family protein n=1 Tax=Comamonas sp. JC664 TaxID=2801917 RepID=UPI00174EA0A0|nr:monovalent cation:proton antiporter-2 (CPA2) family protein [Comamonas sp. JC664]MBL0698901.1 cation:proton antiporter [Comamonas sp. JC664]GHG79450.1 potassium efflux system protein [Comamonas sp. KCTC 72670]
MSFLQQALVFLAAAVVAVPLSRKLGLGSVLGYLAAGAAIGPWGLRLIGDVEHIFHVAELGVVLLLFVIGLELEPRRLWALRRSVFGLGGAQVLLTGLLLAGVGLLLGLPRGAAIITGFGLSLSSTAFALQLLAERNQLTTAAGQLAFGILLFQDLAVVPLLALMPLLGDGAAPSPGPVWLLLLKDVGVLAAVVLAGRYLVRPVFRAVAATHSQELFTATALLVVVGTASLVNAVGLSMALGAFLAGVLLADSEYRHELEADLEPFKGLLMGLFFITVGMSVNLSLILQKPLVVLALVLGLVALKGAVLYGLGRVALKQRAPALDLAVVISQGGEFAFVLFSLATGQHVMERALSELLVVVVGLSMATTPLLYALHERWVRPRLQPASAKREYDVAPTEDNPVIIAGFGRVGQIVGRLLRAKRIGFTAIDASPEQIDFMKRFGSQVFYGDASRLDLLRAARAEKARVFVLAIDDIEASLRTARAVKEHFPHLVLFARARNRVHAYQLLDMGIDRVTRETFLDSLEMGTEVLQELGLTYSESRRAHERMREHDEHLLRETARFHRDEKKLVELADKARKELESLFEQDEAEQSDGAS